MAVFQAHTFEIWDLVEHDRFPMCLDEFQMKLTI